MTIKVAGATLALRRWTWFCVAGDTHPNVLSYGVIARALEAAVP